MGTSRPPIRTIGVHPIARGEGVLEIVVLPRQHLTEQSLEKALPDASPHLWRAQDLLEPGDVLADVEDPLGDLPELAQAPVPSPSSGSRAASSLATPVPTWPICTVMWEENCCSCLPHGADRLGLRQPRLGPRRLDLPLEEQHGLIRLAPARLRAP